MDAVTLAAANASASKRFAKDTSLVYLPAGGLSNWATAKSQAGSRLVTVGMIGDSISQIFYASTFAKSYAGLLRAGLQTKYSDGGSGFCSVANSQLYYSASSAYNALWPVAFTGTWTNGAGTGTVSNGYGPGSTFMYSTTVGDKVTFTGIRGTSIRVSTLDYGVDVGLTPSAFTVAVDGTTVGTVTPAHGATSTPRFDTFTVAAGTHTVVLTQAGSAGQYLAVHGVGGVNATGIAVHNFARASARSITYGQPALSNGGYPGQWSGGDKNPVDLLIVNLGVNDANNAASALTYTSNVRRILHSARSLGTADGHTDICLLANPVGTYDDTNMVYDQYIGGLRDLAGQYGAALVNLWAGHRMSRGIGMAASYYGDSTNPGAAGTDPVHPGDTGHQWLYNQLSPVLV